MEHCGKGDLSKKLKAIKQRGRRMTEAAAWKIILQTADAMGYIHSMKVLHRGTRPMLQLGRTAALSIVRSRC